MTKQYAVLEFNLDVFAKPIKVIYNDDVKDTTEAQQVLKKFMLVDKNDSTIRKT